ncbi:MAG: ATP-binding protein [bacterium]
MKNFRLVLIIKVLLLAGSIGLSFMLLYLNLIIFACIFSVSLIPYQIILLIKYVDRTNKELVDFLQAINYSDYSVNYNFNSLGKSFKNISDEFNKVLQKFKQSRSDKEESLLYLQTAIEHIGVGLISFDSKGKIDLINRGAKKTLKLTNVKNLSSLNNISPNLGDYIFNLLPGQQCTNRIITKDENIYLLMYATEFKMRKQLYKLVTLQNIQPELERKEIEAYQKLIRVLTHEIMNSVTPISSLASTVNLWLSSNSKEEIMTTETLDDISAAVTAIKKRSEGLVKFVEKYRDLAKIPKPAFEVFKVAHLFERLKILMESGLRDSGIKFSYDISPMHLELTADPDLLEQVLINLLNNAVQSLKNKQHKNVNGNNEQNKNSFVGTIDLKAAIDDRGRANIKVVDNGEGITEDIIEKIFIPFFSTKQEGSGIGLSISQQIIHSHYGSLSVSSKPNEETVFTIRL